MSKVICPKLLGKLKVIGVASTRLARSITIKRNPAPHTYSSAYVQLLNARPKPPTPMNLEYVKGVKIVVGRSNRPDFLRLGSSSRKKVGSSL